MGKRAALIEKYARDLREKCGTEPNMALLTKITLGCGPALYEPGGDVLADNDSAELEHLRQAFLIRKLGLADGPGLTAAIDAAIEIYGRAETPKFRPVIYYLLVRQFGKEGQYL